MTLLEVYLPIAGIRIDVLILIAIGVVTGVIAGIFGLGGGIISVPSMMFIGVPPHVAVACAANQMTAGSCSSFIAYARRGKVDYKLGSLMLFGGLIGSVLGVSIFNKLSQLGQVDFVISILFLVILGFISWVTSKDAVLTIYYNSKGIERPKPRRKPILRRIHLPFRTEFVGSSKEISLLSPIIIGFIGGIFVSIMGVGGGFFTIPAMIYVLRVHTSFTPGSTHFQLIFTSIIATTLHAVTSHSVDIVLSSFLIVGTVVGAQIGVKIGSKIEPDRFRILLAIIMVAICVKVAYGMLLEPSELFQVKPFLR